jgi:hypothetical protein
VGGRAGGRVCLPRAPGARAPYIEVEPLFPPGTAFARLTHLEISDYEREHPPGCRCDGAVGADGVRGAARPGQAQVRLEGRWGGGLEEVRTRVAPALEAVAGTLTHLHLESSEWEGWRSDEEGGVRAGGGGGQAAAAQGPRP